MKRVLVFFLLVLSLSACAGSSSLDRHNCSQGVCIEVRAVEPIRFGGGVTVTVVVTSEKDIPDLWVSVNHDLDVIMEEPQGWEKEVRDTWKGKAGASWKVTAKANQSMRFTRTLRLPAREGLFDVTASASIPGSRVTDSLRIYLTREGGKVYLSGTPIPLWTPGKPIPAVTITPGPSPTRIRPTTPTRPLTATPTAPPPTTPTRPPYPPP